MLRTTVTVAAAASAAKSGSPWPSFALDARANAIVYGIAELEAFTKAIITYAHVHINSERIAVSDIRPCMRRLAVHDTFKALRDLSDPEKVWNQRLYATTLEAQDDIINLPVVDVRHAPPPLDGKTPTVRHFTLIWSVYGLPDTPFPKAPWLGTLKKLALARNDLAHGNVPYEEFFLARGYDFLDVERYMNDLEGLMKHYASIWDTYISARGYLAQPGHPLSPHLPK